MRLVTGQSNQCEFCIYLLDGQVGKDGQGDHGGLGGLDWSGLLWFGLV